MAGTITPSSAEERSRNPLRPQRFEDIIGQADAVKLLKRACDAAFVYEKPVDHVLLIGPSGIGKTTLATCTANDLGVDCYQLAAPVSLATLQELAAKMHNFDVLFVDEIHMQAVRERRGRDSATEPEVWFQLLEDKVLMTPSGPIPFPDITVIGGTTDPGMLPEPFLNRFPLRPRLTDYSPDEAVQIARYAAGILELSASDSALRLIAGAARWLPREITTLLRNAKMFAFVDGNVSDEAAREVLAMNGLTDDGLTAQMQGVLTFLYTHGRRTRGDGQVTYQASVATLASAVGLSRDVKAIQLHVEPWLLKQGLVGVASGGRFLTDAGIKRARELLAKGP